MLNALAIGILVYLVVEIAGNATQPIVQAVSQWHAYPSSAAMTDALWLILVFVGGLFIGLVGLGSARDTLDQTRRRAERQDPLRARRHNRDRHRRPQLR